MGHHGMLAMATNIIMSVTTTKIKTDKTHRNGGAPCKCYAPIVGNTGCIGRISTGYTPTLIAHTATKTIAKYQNHAKTNRKRTRMKKIRKNHHPW